MAASKKKMYGKYRDVYAGIARRFKRVYKANGNNMAFLFEVTDQTFRKWPLKFPDFAKAINTNKELPKIDIEYMYEYAWVAFAACRMVELDNKELAVLFGIEPATFEKWILENPYLAERLKLARIWNKYDSRQELTKDEKVFLKENAYVR